MQPGLVTKFTRYVALTTYFELSLQRVRAKKHLGLSDLTNDQQITEYRLCLNPSHRYARGALVTSFRVG